MSDFPIIALRAVGASYGATRALHDVTLDIERGSTTAILGINGAGKSTTLYVMAGLMQPDGGELLLDGTPVPRRRKEGLMRPRLALSPEGRRVFPDLSVMENLLVGAFRRRDRAHVEADLAVVLDLFPRLLEREKQAAGTLSGGEQQMLAMGRALMRRPEVLLLDEPTLGLSPVMVKVVAEAIRKLATTGLTIVLVEQSTKVALSVSESAYVLGQGTVVLQAPSKELQHDQRLLNTYLGGNEPAATPSRNRNEA